MIWAAGRGAPSMMSHTQVGDLRSSLVDRRLAKNPGLWTSGGNFFGVSSRGEPARPPGSIALDAVDEDQVRAGVDGLGRSQFGA